MTENSERCLKRAEPLMRDKKIIAFMMLVFAVGVPCHGQDDGPPKAERSLQCTSAENPRYFCEVHQVSFEAVEVPIAYGLPGGFILSVGYAEHSCRHKLAASKSFPHAAPRSISGGCMVMEEKSRPYCACAQCTAAERSWLEAYKDRTDVTPYQPWVVPGEGISVETNLYLHIQERRAFEEYELADCLQRTWEFHFDRK